MEKRKDSRNSIKEKRAGYVFVLPAILFLLLLVLYPLTYNITMSFRDVTLKTFNAEQEFVGLKNYVDVLAMPVVRKAIFNTLFFTVVSLIFQFVIGFALVLLFAKKYGLSELSRGLLMVCWLIPVLVFATIWKWIFAGDTSGILNYILIQLHVIETPIRWLTTTNGAMTALIIANIWRGVPFNMLLLATGLTTLPMDVFEAAAIDGASKCQRFFRITIPLLKSTIISVITLGFINTFKVFDLIYVMTKGGPLDSTQILSTVSYKMSFSNFEFGQGAAVANIMLVLMLIVGFFHLKITDREGAE